jgi:hypothetical protein
MRRGTDNLFHFALAAVVVWAAIVAAQSSLADFGINESQLKSQMARALVSGYIPLYPNSKQYHSATAAAQAAFLKNTLGWMKTYTESQAFQADYDKQRASAKPTPPKSQGTPDEQFAKYLADQRKSIEEMKKNVAQMPPDMQKQMQATVQQMEAQVAQTANNPQMAAMMKQGFAQQAESDQKNYEKELADYGSRYPADSKALIARRLHEFLDLSKDVAFDAKLVPAGNGKMKFADAQYEAKPAEWKLCYRAGKEPVEAARAFATDWLRQIEKR